MRVYSNKERPFSEIRHIAVAIKVVREGQQHLAILHKSENLAEVRLGHLEWNNILTVDNPNDSYLWVDPMIPARRAKTIAATCRYILNQNSKGIPFAFSSPEGCFDLDSGCFLGSSRVGLTCSTFVLGVFGNAGVHLAVYDTWPPHRPGDAEWKEERLRDLEKTPAVTDEFLARAKEEAVNAIRYRPEDVAGCAAAELLPCPFGIAEKLSFEVLKKLLLHGKPPEKSG